MGTFQYSPTVKVEIEDLLLLHLQVVIGTKLRRGEPFLFTWRQQRTAGDGTVIVWVSAASRLTYRYSGSRTPELDNRWLELLMHAASSPSGLYPMRAPEIVDTHATAAEHEYLRPAGEFS